LNWWKIEEMKHIRTCLLIIAAIAVICIAPSIIAGSTKFLIVLSGSMDPIMRVGDVAVISHVAPENVDVGDIIAFKDPSGRENVIITHRIVEVTEGEDATSGLSFKTKGDACEDVDQFDVPAEDIVGKTVFLIPFIGYFIHYAGKTMLFLLFFIITPAMLIIVDEMRVMSNPAIARKMVTREKKKERKKRMKVDYKRFFSIFIIVSIPFLILSAPSLAKCGTVKDMDKQELKNEGLLPCVIVFSTAETGKIAHQVLLKGNVTEIGTGTEDEVSISSAPYIMPVFWIVRMASINPFLPAFITALIPGLIISLIFYPLWHNDIRRRRSKRR
jgi:signal peptidase